MYLRISLDSTGEGLALDRQRGDCEKIAARNGWQVTKRLEFSDSISASDKRKDRPGYEALVEAYGRGEFGALLCYDLDRLTRQPRQLEDWIDAAEERGLALVTANGEADLRTDGGRLFARMKVAVAKSEVERKSARQKAAGQQRARLGRAPLGSRLMGYTVKHEIIPAEAAVVEDIFKRAASGESLRSIVAYLNDTGVPTRHGKPWLASTVRDMLVNPRYAGRRAYRPEVIENGKRRTVTKFVTEGSWEPIVDPDLFDAVVARLSDPRRRTSTGTDRKHIGSGLYRCGIEGCDQPLRSMSGDSYRCRTTGHVSRTRVKVDKHVLDVLRTYLGRPDLRDTLPGRDSADRRALDAEAARLRNRKKEIEDDYDNGLIDGLRYRTALDKVEAELNPVDVERMRGVASTAVSAILRADDPVAAFDAAGVGTQQAVLDTLYTVHLLPAPRGIKTFDIDSVRITPRTAAS